ncbi:MAG: hypothetical protein PSX81_10390 [bacterium]|nr:hypothetical protein [bacterium]
MKGIFLILSLMVFCELKSQGVINVIKPVGLDGLIWSRTAARKHPDAKMDGYHILIFRGDNRNKAESQKAMYDAMYRQYSEVVWEEPNFKVYVGLFKNRMECMGLFNELKDQFQTAIIVRDKIMYPPLN